MFNDKSDLITGGTGSFGKAFVKNGLAGYPDINRLVVYSRDELKQFEMSQQFPDSQYKDIRCFICVYASGKPVRLAPRPGSVKACKSRRDCSPFWGKGPRWLTQ